MHFSHALLFLLVATPLAFGEEPQWIWHGEKAANDEVRFFRKTFSLGSLPASASLELSCDNRALVFLNGTEIGRTDAWERPLRERVEKQLKAGENVIAIRGKNDDGIAALVVRLELKDAAGKKTTIISDATWLSIDREQAGWEKPGFVAANWGKPFVRGALGTAPWGDVLGGAAKAVARGPSPAASLKTLPSFKAELIRVADPGEGSWVSMTADDKGRLIVSSQNKPQAGWGGLLRFTLSADGTIAQTEKLNSPIGEAMGLLWAFDSLYVDGNGPQGYGLYRLKFKDDQPAASEFLLRGANGEHGSHGVVLGADRQLYLMVGNHTPLLKDLKATSPFKGWAEDHLLPRQWDANGHAVGVLTPGGHVLRSADEGKTWEIFCGSFRNAYDLAFNADGELFTFDSDMEWDLGTPWYRPTRVNHLVSGGEYGWRSGTSNQPEYYPDSLPATVDIGIGSPTGVIFGTGGKRWPAKYQRALFAMDWANGKIFAIQLRPNGSSYSGDAEVFVEGKPLNVTDLDFVNGDLYFTCGGRGTQAALYRVTYAGANENATLQNATLPGIDSGAVKTRALRRSLEAFHGRTDVRAVAMAWPHLESTDRFLRWAARTAIEFQPVEQWQQRALAEQRPQAALEAMLALIRCGGPAAKAELVKRICALPFERLDEEQRLAVIRLSGLVFTRLGPPSEDERQLFVRTWSPRFPKPPGGEEPSRDWINPGLYKGRVALRSGERFNRELSVLLTFLDAPGTVEKTMGLLRTAPSQEEQLHYIFVLRNGQQYAAPGEKKPAGPLSGWTPDLRREYFSWFLRANTEYSGGASFKKFLANIKTDALTSVSEHEKTNIIADLIHPAAAAPITTAASAGHPRGFVKSWTMEELVPAVGTAKGSAIRGRTIATEAQCLLCHRFGEEGGAVGPDLTGVAGRFNRHDQLEAMIDPNKVVSDQYRNEEIVTKNGREIVGRLVDDQPDKLVLAENPFSNERTEIRKSEITKRGQSLHSLMPPGLLNVFSKDEIVDMLTFFEGGASPPASPPPAQ